MASSHLTDAQQTLLEAMQKILASGQYADTFQAVFPRCLPHAHTLFFTRHDKDASMRSLPCHEADFLALVQQGYITVVHEGHETYWGSLTPSRASGGTVATIPDATPAHPAQFVSSP